MDKQALEKKSEALLRMRHSCEHVLTMVMVRLYQGLKPAMGPATEEGFYLDFDYSGKVSEEDFPKIEEGMQRIIKADLPIVHSELSIKEAKKVFADNPYKIEWSEEADKRGEKVSIYTVQGESEAESFIDVCKGPHVESTGKIGPLKLLSVAGAYWHGDEKNKMLTRIYGTCFPTQKELDDYLKMLEEAKKRDHRRLGQELGLFVFSDLVGKGLPLLTDKGATIRRELERFIVDEELKRGYKHVVTPPLARVDLYHTSGHYPYYKETMYPPMVVDDEELILRPMTCPHHFMLYKSEIRSYKELPLRIAEISPQFRYEKSGELTGLMRVRMFTLYDAHIFCTPGQVKQVTHEVLELIDYANGILKLQKGKDYLYRLSLGDRADDKKYFKDDQAWEKAENILREVLKEVGAPFYEALGEAAFYGPKIDIQMKNVLGKEETAFTVQYDFVMPKRFELNYVDKDGKEKEVVVIHRSSIGAFERILAFLIEHYAGNFPVWLAPTQVQIIPITDRHNEYAQKVLEQLINSNIRVELDDRSEKMQAKIRDAQLQKIPYMLVIGDKEVSEKAVAVRTREGQDLGAIKLDEFKAKLEEEVKNRV